MAIHDKKKIIHVVNVFEIRDSDSSNLSLKSSKSIPVLSLTKIINKNSSENESFLLDPGFLIFHVGILMSNLCICLCLTKNASC